MSEPVLQFDRIVKTFFGVRVLREVSFSLEAGSTLGLVGENGAGKSTLMNILGGAIRPDSGEMRLNQKLYEPRNPRDAARNGIAFIHQELNLFPNLSIAENIFLTAFPRHGIWPWIRRRDLRAQTEALLREASLPVAPETLVERLSQGERQLVEIAKALRLDARIVIFDEPTTSLTAREAERLFEIMRRLRARKISMIYISHILRDVLRLCDDIVVLRDGAVAGQGARSDFTEDRMISLMVGRQLNQLYPERAAALTGEPALEVTGLSHPGIVKDISFTLRKGEVLGISGLMGSGRSELARILFGLDPAAAGEIRVQGKRLPRLDARGNIRRGVAFLTENRRDEGLMLEASVADNMALVSAPAFANAAGWINRAKLAESVRDAAQAVRVRSDALATQPVRSLSGGNQQKVVFAKWLLHKPAVFIMDEPTRGVDVGAKSEIYNLINDLAAGGMAVLLISSEIEELIGMCDRILVMSRGALTGSVGRADFDREKILRAALGGTEQ